MKMNNSRIKALWLVSWYPSRLEPLNGDFIKRHAEAVSLYAEVEVIYVVRDEKGVITRGVLMEKSKNRNLIETVIYYYFPQHPIPLFDKIISGLKYRHYYKKAIKEFFKTKERPDIVHLHVSLKAGPIALWIKRRYHIEYVLSEHWTGFLPEASAEFRQLPLYSQKMSYNVIRKARAVSTVSEYLAVQLKKNFSSQNFTVIPNVVDTRIFRPGVKKPGGPVRFIHISTLRYQKNPEDILKAIAIVKQTYTNFYLDIFGPENLSLVDLTRSLDLQNHVRFHREVAQEQLATYMQQSDALILYSRYETFGCVLIEAQASGLPVIVSDIEIMHENVPNFAGLFVEGENSIALSQKIFFFIGNREYFDRNKIASAILRFSYQNVGMIFNNWYYKVKKYSN